MPASRNVGQPTSHVFCSACGVKNAANHTFCSACGTRLVSPHTAPTMPMNAYRQPQPTNSLQYSEQIWRWFRKRHAAIQIVGWLVFWWLLLPVLIWRTTWNTKVKLALSAPFALFVFSALLNGPQDRRPTEQGLQPAVAVADTQTRGTSQAKLSERTSVASTERPTSTPRTSAPVIPTPQPPTTVPLTAVPSTPIPLTAELPTLVPPTTTPLIPIARATTAGNIRSYPSTESGKVINKIAVGETITLISRTPDGAWYEMTIASGVKGYVSASLLELAPGVSDIVAAKDAGPPPVAAKPPSRAAAKPSAQCDPNYSGACIPLVDYDLNCPDVGVKDFYVVGYDKHRFDRDRDGLACES